MKNYSNIVIVASFFGLWIDSYLTSQFQIILGFFLIFTFGILHGANDILLIQHLNPVQKKNSQHKTLLYYVVVVLVGVLLFYTLPQVALLLFIIVSAYHFGEQQWHSVKTKLNNLVCILFQFLYGLILLLLLFYFHSNQVQDIVHKITHVTVPLAAFTIVLQITAILFGLFICYLFWKFESLRSKIALEVFFLILFAILFKASSLIWGFALYFVLWHSIPSIIDQIIFLNGTFTFKHFKAYCKAAFIYWFVSIVGIAILFFICKDEHFFNALFFSFLAAITFPHAAVIANMSNEEKNNTL
ncbi:Brp/Blh family beta-carotene 15,15'-dioxygenase [Flavobacterium sp. CHNK8]|uniref:Brp/Blh family beta-carotene 15,15'-dioxygenase n=1 Tax=Flavobacterium sp. CHNK8 TaxID=2871165 RepID=UPI001C8E74ED|nr:Brp/Blh family beta-carotene 15,15'-dioxygenase [Flavobacterium sp. CHNK8]QZK90151.1 Brp/Blh family beta-carotene 15,15'-dioxygenase [Flavobacterium sp. CHNK8]